MTIMFLLALGLATWLVLATLGMAARPGASRRVATAAIGAAALQIGAGTGWFAARGYPLGVGVLACTTAAALEIGTMMLLRRRQTRAANLGSLSDDVWPP